MFEAIRTLTHDPIRAQYPFLSLFNSLFRLITIWQQDTESLQEYIVRFKQVRDNFKKHCGTKFLDHFVELLAEYKENGTDNPDDPPTTEQLEMKDKAFNQFMALIAFKGADQNKYGSVTWKFATDYTLNNDKYPRILEKLSDTLTSHKCDDTYFEKKKRTGAITAQQAGWYRREGYQFCAAWQEDETVLLCLW